MLKNDKWIKEMAINHGMIEPFVDRQVREVDNVKVLSYGTSSYGYDLRLSPNDFRVFRHIPGTVVNPKRFNANNLVSVELQHDEDGDFFIIPANSYALGVALEKLRVPPNITIICVGKSSYARCFTGNTKVKLVDGDFTFLELIERVNKGEQLFGYGVTQGNEIIVQELILPRFIEKSPVVRVHLDDGSFVDCTPDHRFLMRDGSYKEASTLEPKDSLFPIYQHSSHGYPTIYNSVKASRSKRRHDGWKELHHMVDDYLVRNGLAEPRGAKIHVHHIDENKLNAHPSNLARISSSDHTRMHNLDGRARLGGQAAASRYNSSPEYREFISQRLHSKESKQKAYQARKHYLHSPENFAQLDVNREKMWQNEKRRQKQSEVAIAGIGSIKRRPDITEQTLISALLQSGSIRGAAKLLKVDRSAFRRFSNVIQKFKAGELCYNHKVIRVEILAGDDQDTYCLTAPETGNFALSAGVFVSNCGVIANVTPAEASWIGHLTLEFSNSSSADCRVYANEGILQLLFLEGEPCETTYADRRGKYQGQSEEITLARV